MKECMYICRLQKTIFNGNEYRAKRKDRSAIMFEEGLQNRIKQRKAMNACNITNYNKQLRTYEECMLVGSFD
jgi:hypothetical protein